MLPLKQLKRNQSVLGNLITEMDDKLVAKNKCSIVVPFRYVKARLLELGKINYIATIFPVVSSNGEYGISNICSSAEFVCNDIEIIKEDGEEHYCFNYDKGDVIFPTLELVKDDGYSYLIYDEFVQKAKAPWFLNYADIGRIMVTARSYSGINLADTNAIFEIITATLTRNDDLTKYYREVINDLSQQSFDAHPKQSINLNSIVYASVNKMNKLMGGYIEDGLASALTEDKSAKSGIETLLRKQ